MIQLPLTDKEMIEELNIDPSFIIMIMFKKKLLKRYLLILSNK